MNDSDLIRFIQHKNTKKEAHDILRWIEESEENKAHFSELQLLWCGIELEKIPLQEKETISNKLVASKKNIFYKERYFWLSIASTVAIILISTMLFIRKGKPTYQELLGALPINNEITIFSGNNIIATVLEKEADLIYSKNQLTINDDTFQLKETDDYYTLQVPYGKRATLVLADQSKVILNSGSTIVFPETFQEKHREVFIKGEAYFDITKNEKKHFFVKSDYKTIEVKGTEFNVRIDSEEKIFETVLVHGSICINEENNKEIKPNELYSFSDASKKETIKEVDPDTYTAWINNKLKFDEEPLSNVLRRLEKKYDIHIRLLKNGYDNFLISGNLDTKQTPEEVMNIIMQIILPEEDPSTLYEIR